MEESGSQAAPRLVANRYRLGTMSGRGGMGMVWQATDELIGRAVAVKELRPPAGLSAEEQALVSQRALEGVRSRQCQTGADSDTSSRADLRWNKDRTTAIQSRRTLPQRRQHQGWRPAMGSGRPREASHPRPVVPSRHSWRTRRLSDTQPGQTHLDNYQLRQRRISVARQPLAERRVVLR
jgi:hypothetical protein